eukprot:6194795-Pleurochrysis_carterae.AAC.4
MDCVWKAAKEGVPETAATGSGRKRLPRWINNQGDRSKPPPRRELGSWAESTKVAIPKLPNEEAEHT